MRFASTSTHSLSRTSEAAAAWILGLLWVLPLAYAVWTAFHPGEYSTRFVLSAPLTLENFVKAWNAAPFARYFVNTIALCAMILGGQLVLCTLAAYGFARYPFRGSRLILSAILITRMVTPASLVLPLYIMMESLHLSNTLFAVTVGITVLNLPFAVWLLKPFFDALPREIEEAALLDGLGPIGVWWRIAVPIAGPGFKTVALFSFIAAWTDLLIPITMSTRPNGWTLAAGIIQMQTGFKIYWGALMSGGLYLTLPTFLIAFVAQRYLTRGIRASF